MNKMFQLIRRDFNSRRVLLKRRGAARDAAGRLTRRTHFRFGDETNRTDAFGYNPRSELTQAVLGANGYAYAFDPIGNRLTADEPESSATYSANSLNQYSLISNRKRFNFDSLSGL